MTMSFSKSRRTRSLRLFQTMNQRSRHHQPIVKKVVVHTQPDEDETVNTELDMSTSMSNSNLGCMEDSLRISSNHTSSRRCSFMPPQDISFAWDDDDNDIDNDNDMSAFLDLSIRSVRGVKHISNNNSMKQCKGHRSATELLNDSVTGFFHDRVNTFTNNMNFLARKLTPKHHH